MVAPVVARDVPTVIEATGTVEPIRTAAVEAQVGGLLEKVAFREGDQVKQGQVLFQLDARSYQASLQQAEAAVLRDAAQLTSASRDQQRFEALAAKEFVTSQQLDQARATAASAAATVSSDSAMLTQARLNLQFATIRAPIDGLAGGLLVKEGNLVKANASTPMVVINQISPILVRFAVPSTHLGEIRHKSSQTLQVQATPVGQATTGTQTGQLTFIDNGVDSLTGTVLLKASFANKDGSLWPGGLVRVVLRLDVQKGAMVVPATAVVNSQQGSIVYVLGADKKVSVRQVQVGQSDDTTSVLLSGVKLGETVVTDGQLRLTEGVKVAVRADSSNQAGMARDTLASVQP
ncbi:MAG: efflux RND transporter periplasmic adaptor subunit [Gemmatimonadota bacterium]